MRSFLVSSLLASSALALTQVNGTFKYVATFSIDGLHSSDVTKYLLLRPNSTIAALLANGYEYANAWTSAPSDSFPGTVAQFTGGSPLTTGVWYDDSYSRAFYAPGSNCSGLAGSEVLYDETIDYNSTLLFSGGINPANLPRTLINGTCMPVYPHQRLNVNTVFEVVRNSGKQTAYTDKHPAYDIVRGPSGNGLTTGYFPEIAAVSGTLNATIAYDQMHVNAFLSWLSGSSIANSTGNITAVPSLWGGNFQSVSVAQKKYGYQNSTGNPFSSQLLMALDSVDSQLGSVVSKMKSVGVYSNTLIVVASKHGQSPINPAKYATVDPAKLQNATGVSVAQLTADDIGIFWLKNQSDIVTAVQNLNASRSALQIAKIYYGESARTANFGAGFGIPYNNPNTPDIIVQPNEGIIYTTSTSKIAEHGGLSPDDRHVACFVSNPSLKYTKVQNYVSTRQVAPTILKALGLNPKALEAVVVEGVKAFPGFAS